MPHTTDRRRAQERAEQTVEPLALARRGLAPRGSALAVPEQQRILQSVLFECFARTRAQHRWDPLTGRNLSDLYASYGSWMSPQADRIIFGATCAVRFSGYLLPFVDPDSARPRCAGIPGLRYAGPHPGGYELHHLPTGVRIQILDGNRGHTASLRSEVACNRRDELARLQPVWEEEELSDAEARWAPVWQPHPHARLASQLFHGLSLFEFGPPGGRHARHLTFARARHQDAHSSLSWCGGVPPASVGSYLLSIGVAAPGELHTALLDARLALLRDGAGQTMELSQRAGCTHCDPCSSTLADLVHAG